MIRTKMASPEKATLYVGTNVGSVKEFTDAQVVDNALSCQLLVGMEPNLTAIPALGAWTSPDGSLTREESIQIVLLKPLACKHSHFESNVLRVAELLCARLRQESVYVEIGSDMWEITPSAGEGIRGVAA